MTLFNYKDPSVRDTIQSLKYDASSHAASLCAEALADYLHEEIVSIRTFSSFPVLLVPIPLHAKRQRERGYNQIQRILDALPDEFRDGTLSSVAPDILIRTRATLAQTKLSRTKRLANVKNAFAATRAIQNTHIILIDDVTTTGATLLHAGKPLESPSTPIIRIALARA